MGEKNQTVFDYPEIPDRLMECLERDFKNKLPEHELSLFELGRLIGRQDVISKLKAEKSYNENNTESKQYS